MGQCYAFTAARGGDGQSTACAALAMALAKRGKKVLLIDLCTNSPALDVIFKLSESVVYTFSDVVEKTATFKQAALVSPDDSNIRLIPDGFGVKPSSEAICQTLRDIAAQNDDTMLLLDLPCEDIKAITPCLDKLFLTVRPNEISLRSAAFLTSEPIFSSDLCAQLLLNGMSLTRPVLDTQPPLLDMIDRVGLALFGILPDHYAWHSAPLSFSQAYRKTDFSRCADHMAARLLGEQIPLLHRIRPEGISRRRYIERGSAAKKG